MVEALMAIAAHDIGPSTSAANGRTAGQFAPSVGGGRVLDGGFESLSHRLDHRAIIRHAVPGGQRTDLVVSNT